MALPYKRWTEDDIKNKNVVPDGDYKFQIINIIRKNSKGGLDKDGNPKQVYPMIELDFNFWDNNGAIRKIKDWIVFSEGMDWKLRHLSDTTGLLDLYDAQQLDSHHLDKKYGVFSIGTKEFTGDDGVKRKSNFVKDYVKQSTNSAIAEDFFNDDIPF